MALVFRIYIFCLLPHFSTRNQGEKIKLKFTEFQLGELWASLKIHCFVSSRYLINWDSFTKHFVTSFNLYLHALL